MGENTRIMFRGLIERLFGTAAPGNRNSSAAHALLYYVKGNKCGAITRVRIDTRNDLSRDDDDLPFVRKVIVDSACYGQVEIELHFDNAYRELSRRIDGGVFVDQDAWRATQTINLKSD
jgi:hypothetical protein